MIPRRRLRLDPAAIGDALRCLNRDPASASGQVRDFERAFAASVGQPYALATASGRDALGLILDALGLARGDELIIPAWTLGELLPLLRARGLVLRAADIDPDSYNLTPASVAAQITPRSRAILALHALGAPCDIEGLCRLAAAHDIALIEDCAHATGARVAGRAVGGFGRAALFSLETTKGVPTFGGGMLVTADAELRSRVDAALAGRPRREGAAMRRALLKTVEEFGVRSPLYGPLARLLFSERGAAWFDRHYRAANDRVRGAPAAYGAFQARLGLRRLAQLDDYNAAWQAACADLARQLPDALRPQRRDTHGSPAAYQFVARFAGDVAGLRRAALAAGLDLGIGDEVMTDVAALLGQDDCPVAAAVHASALQIPLHAGTDAPTRRRMAALLACLAEQHA